jgi:hypothetical protein
MHRCNCRTIANDGHIGVGGHIRTSVSGRDDSADQTQPNTENCEMAASSARKHDVHGYAKLTVTLCKGKEEGGGDTEVVWPNDKICQAEDAIIFEKRQSNAEGAANCIATTLPQLGRSKWLGSRIAVFCLCLPAIGNHRERFHVTFEKSRKIWGAPASKETEHFGFNV